MVQTAHVVILTLFKVVPTHFDEGKNITGYQRSTSWSRNLSVAKPNHGLDQWEHS